MGIGAATPALPDALTLGAVHLRVRSLADAVAWYERSLGLVERRRDPEAGVAELGDGQSTVIVLHEDGLADPAGRTAGLYHYALLFPSRQELARAALRLAATRTPIEGASDHRTHEAIYLPDLDGNGIELAADRPRELWPSNEALYAGRPAPLDTDSLLATIAGEAPNERVRDGLRVGHVHLHVGDVEQALAFYRDLVGLELQASIGSAAFLSAGGYHHHLGVNVWNGKGVGPPSAHTVGLVNWTVRLPRAADVADVQERLRAAGVAVEPYDGGLLAQDPWGSAVAFVAAG
jgi:catechol 2,3-dioxygenase